MYNSIQNVIALNYITCPLFQQQNSNVMLSFSKSICSKNKFRLEACSDVMMDTMFVYLVVSAINLLFSLFEKLYTYGCNV